MKELKVEVKNVYGVEKIYPRCDKSELFAQIAGTKTLTRESIELIRQLGYEFCVVKNSGVFLIKG
jgi:hypothetical protein